MTLSWNPSPETAVNRTGGGYRIYVTDAPGTALPIAARADVVFDPASGRTPTTAALQLTAGTWYVRVTAYSALNTAGSAPSAPLTVVVP